MFSLLFAVLGFDDALILGGLMAGGAAMSNWLGNRNAKKNAKREAELNYKYSLLMAQNGPSASVEGLRKAGLNPILAATDGAFATPSMPSVKMDTSNNGDVSSHLSNAIALMNADANQEQTAANVALQKTQGELNEQNAVKIGLESQKLKEQIRQIQVDTENSRRTGGLSGGYGATHSAITRATDFLSKNHPSGSSTSSDVVKLHHHPSDSVDGAYSRIPYEHPSQVMRRDIEYKKTKSSGGKVWTFDEDKRSKDKHHSIYYR